MKKILNLVLFFVFLLVGAYGVYKWEGDTKRADALAQLNKEQEEIVDVYKARLHQADTLLVDFNRQLAKRLQNGEINSKDAAYLLKEIANNWPKTE